jgi:HEPN domain-containing protein
MKKKRLSSNDSLEWLNRANSNLLRAQTMIEGVYLEDLCFDAHQAAEKAIKAVLISKDINFPYIHDLGELIAILQRSGTTVPKEILQAARLTRFAVATRYPGVVESVTRSEYLEAVTIARDVVSWSASILTSLSD